MNAHGETLETMMAFRAGEVDRPARLVCCDCGGEAEGNVSVKDGPLCDRCSAAYDAADAAAEALR